MGAFTQKIAGHFALSFSPFRGQKTRAPNHYFQLGISDSSFEGAKIIRLAPVVNRHFCQSFLPPRGRLLKIYQRPPKPQENSLLFFAAQIYA
jgi:hypothetical protein